MESEGSITHCIRLLKAGERAAAQQLWERYFQQLVGLARARLRGTSRRAADEEDVALGAFESFYQRAERGQFPRLNDRDDLRQLLAVITVRKAIDLVRHEDRPTRGSGRVLVLSELAELSPEEILAVEPTPEFAAQIAEECRRLYGCLGDDTLRGGAVEDGRVHQRRDRCEARVRPANGRAQAPHDPTALGQRGSGLTAGAIFRDGCWSFGRCVEFSDRGNAMDTTRTPPTSNDSLSPSQITRVEEVCDRFEAAWKAGLRPRIEDYLGETADPERAALWHELLVLELAYRRLQGERPTPEEYLEAVPGAGPPGRQGPGRSGDVRSPGPAITHPVRSPRAGVPRSGRNPHATLGNPHATLQDLERGGSLRAQEQQAPTACLLEAALAGGSCSHGGEEAAGVSGSQLTDDPAATLPTTKGGASAGTLALETVSPIAGLGRSNIAETLLGSIESDVPCTLRGEEPAGVSGSHPSDDPAATRRPTEGGASAAIAPETVNPFDGDSPPPWPEDGGPPSIPGYEILELLGRGGMGIVYKALQRPLKRAAALKMIRGDLHVDAEQLGRFRVEAEVIARLKHPNVVQIYEVGEVGGVPYFSLEMLEGGTLAERLAGAPMPPRQAAALAATLARAVGAVHRIGIVHRDLKPANVLFDADGTPKVTDFGLAKRLEVADGHTVSGQIMGTPSYMAPEQAQGLTRRIGPSADIYALGAILYEMLTGRPPFKAPTIMETLRQVVYEEVVPLSRLQSRVPRDLETICLKCLAKESARRYATAEELADDLGRFLAGEAIRARPTPAWERALKWARRRTATATLLVLALMAAVAMAGAGVRDSALRRARQQLEAARVASLRTRSNQALFKGQGFLARIQWDEARVILTNLLTEIRNEPSLADLRAKRMACSPRPRGTRRAGRRGRGPSSLSAVPPAPQGSPVPRDPMHRARSARQ